MGVTLGTNHSETAWGLIMVDFTIEPPAPKTKYVSIEGRDGDLDMSEALGPIKYENRDIDIIFVRAGSIDQSKFDIISNALHGRVVEIKFDHDPNYYYLGRCLVNPNQEDQMHSIISVKAVCSPFKYKTSLTTVSKVATTSGVVATCTVVDRNVKPQIVTSAPVTVLFGGNTYTLSAGTHNMDFELLTGANSLTLTTATGTATVDIKWREQSL